MSLLSVVIIVIANLCKELCQSTLVAVSCLIPIIMCDMDIIIIIIILKFYLFIYGCVGSSFLCEGFLQLRQAGATLHRRARASLSLSRPLLLRSTGSRRAGSVIVAHGPSCSAARGIFPDQGSNPCPLHWQAESQPLHHQGSPGYYF